MSEGEPSNQEETDVSQMTNQLQKPPLTGESNSRKVFLAYTDGYEQSVLEVDVVKRRITRCPPKFKRFGTRSSAEDFLNSFEENNERNFSKYYYALGVGSEVGVFESWKDMKKHFIGFFGARYKRVLTESEGQRYIKLCQKGAAIRGWNFSLAVDRDGTGGTGSGLRSLDAFTESDSYPRGAILYWTLFGQHTQKFSRNNFIECDVFDNLGRSLQLNCRTSNEIIAQLINFICIFHKKSTEAARKPMDKRNFVFPDNWHNDWKLCDKKENERKILDVKKGELHMKIEEFVLDFTPPQVEVSELTKTERTEIKKMRSLASDTDNFPQSFGLEAWRTTTKCVFHVRFSETESGSEKFPQPTCPQPACTFFPQPACTFCGNPNCDVFLTPIPVNSIETVGDRVYRTEKSGITKQLSGNCFQNMEAARIYLDPVVFAGDKTFSKETKEVYENLMNSLGLHVNRNTGQINELNAKIYGCTRSLTFGTKSFPMELIENTLKIWRTTPRVLSNLTVHRENKYPGADTVMKNLRRKIPLFRVWTNAEHDDSVFKWADITEYKENLKNEMSSNIFALFSDDGTRMAVIVASDAVLSIRFGRQLPGTGEYPVMKEAFASVTKSNYLYEVDADLLRKLKNDAE